LRYFLVSDLESNFGARAPLFSGLFIGVSALNFRKGMERHIHLLTVVLVSMNAEFVVVRALVSPLGVGSDGQQAHEGVDLVVVVAVA